MRKHERARRKSKSELEIANALDARLAVNPLAPIAPGTVLELAGKYGTGAVSGGASVFAYKAASLSRQRNRSPGQSVPNGGSTMEGKK
ncbi:hypothetical protein Pst134EB_016481 [Puccinia striiformis f. sp. tritici]|nr:hypothetical protein Pst134EB_016481 [Puccinia striiformis f. sp. tritici]